MATKNYDLEKPTSIKFDRYSALALKREAEEKTISVSTLVRSIVRQHYQRARKR